MQQQSKSFQPLNYILLVLFCHSKQNERQNCKNGTDFNYVLSWKHLSCVTVKMLACDGKCGLWNCPRSEKQMCDIPSCSSCSSKLCSSIFIKCMSSRCQKQHGCQRDSEEGCWATSSPLEMWTVWISGVTYSIHLWNQLFMLCWLLFSGLVIKRQVQVRLPTSVLMQINSFFGLTFDTDLTPRESNYFVNMPQHMDCIRISVLFKTLFPLI